MDNLFLYKIGKASHPGCSYCDEQENTTYYTVLGCTEWKEQQVEIIIQVGKITDNNLVAKMFQSLDTWKAIDKFVNN